MNKNVKASINTSLKTSKSLMKHFAHAYGCLTYLYRPTKKDIYSITKFYEPMLKAELEYEITSM